MPLTYQNGNLVFDGQDLGALARKIGQPFWLLSDRLVRENARQLKAWFARPDQGPVRVYYSAKTNFEIPILAAIKDEGLEAEIACGHELDLCLRAGFRPEAMCFDGPYKRPEAIRAALDAGLEVFNADSPEDAQRISDAAIERGKRVRLTFRINLGIKGILPDFAERYIGKFGVPLAEATEAYRRARQLEGVEVAGVSTHIGSQIPRIDAYIEAVRRLIDLSNALEAEGDDIREINLGGGFPSNSLRRITFLRALWGLFGRQEGAQSPPVSAYGEAIGRAFVAGIARLKGRPTLAIEPGRCVVSSAGIFVAPVIAVKKDWLFLDASVNYLPESFFFAQRRFLPISEPPGNATLRRWNMAGSSLSSADVLGLGVQLPDLREGDHVALLDTGAYTMSRANRFTTLCPAVYLVDGDGAPRLIRRPEETSDVLAPMLP